MRCKKSDVPVIVLCFGKYLVAVELLSKLRSLYPFLPTCSSMCLLFDYCLSVQPQRTLYCILVLYIEQHKRASVSDRYTLPAQLSITTHCEYKRRTLGIPQYVHMRHSFSFFVHESSQEKLGRIVPRLIFSRSSIAIDTRVNKRYSGIIVFGKSVTVNFKPTGKSRALLVLYYCMVCCMCAKT